MIGLIAENLHWSSSLVYTGKIYKQTTDCDHISTITNTDSQPQMLKKAVFFFNQQIKNLFCKRPVLMVFSTNFRNSPKTIIT